MNLLIIKDVYIQYVPTDRISKTSYKVWETGKDQFFPKSEIPI